MLFSIKSVKAILRDLILMRDVCTNSVGAKQPQVHSYIYTDTKDSHDQLVVSCVTTSAGNEAVVISGAERKLRLAVC